MARGDDRAMDELAERVSAHGSIARAARAMGVSTYRAAALWGRICARLGRQADD